MAQQSSGVDHQSQLGDSSELTATVDLECRYVRELVLDAFARRPAWSVACVSGAGEDVSTAARTSLLHWGEYERICWDAVHKGAQWASAYCVRKGLTRKAHLAHNARKWAAKHPGGRLAGAVPETWPLELDDPEYVDEALCDVPEVRDMADGAAVWIAKPSITNQATGICIFDRVGDLRAALEASEDLREWVLQRYIDRPLLVGGRKFHIRAYVLCIGSLAVYVYSDALALFAAKPYAGAPLTDLAAHLTNTCRARRGASPPDSDAEEATGGGGSRGWREEDAVRLVSELPQLLEAEGLARGEAEARVRQLMSDVHAVLGECLEAVSGELSFFTLPTCFELFGFDLVVDEDWHVWLLEANAEPDMAQTGERLRPLVAGLVEGILALVADPLVRLVRILVVTKLTN
ncbi:hypothetical protein WJX81_005431 [Elliptochloris bilobata]|uniref:Tubulin-tyrosine ligase n=1 Tax=Elliptochloris bilobata TaxID=381761 RepID=A0AAW1QYI1_9CHLO